MRPSEHLAVRHTARRAFLKTLGTAAVAAPFLARDLLANPPSRRVRHAAFGASNMAWNDLNAIAAVPNVEIVAVCDVDTRRMDEAKKRFPKARFYQDWRRLLDAEAGNIDSVNVSTPDHTHAPIGVSAMLLGKHVYGQKPLAHNLHETRRMTELARERGLVTQMGIQIHSGAYYRGAVQLLKAGAIGKVREVHSWCFKHWGDRAALPNRRDTAPPELDWDLWLGVREARPYIGGDYYHPENWRKRLDFGVGTLGDMACHIFDPVFNALALGAPVAVRSDGPAPNKTNWALDAKVALTFAGTEFTAGKTLKLTWYDGDARPPAHITRLIEQDVLPEGGEGDTDGDARPRTRITRPVEPNELPEGGSIFVGTDGVLFLQHIRPARLFPTAKFADFKAPRERSLNHWASFVEAVRGNGRTTAGFDFAGPLTEAVLLGGVASRFPGEDLPWDTKALKFGNAAANQYVREPYRKGWEVAGL